MISVLLAVNKDHDGLLKKTLKSLESQTYQDWELVVVDDGSKDDTHEVIVDFQRNHVGKVLILTNQVNVGLTKSLIWGAKHCKGGYIARIDSGDEYFPDKLKKQIDFLVQNPEYGLIGCGYINRQNGKNKMIKVPISDGLIRKTIHRINPFAHSCVVMRKEIYEKTGGYDADIIYGQDYDLWFRFLKITKAANISECLCFRNVHDDSISISKQKLQMKQCLKTQWKYMNKLNLLYYFYLIEPILVMIIPRKLKRIIKNFF